MILLRIARGCCSPQKQDTREWENSFLHFSRENNISKRFVPSFFSSFFSGANPWVRMRGPSPRVRGEDRNSQSKVLRKKRRCNDCSERPSKSRRFYYDPPLHRIAPGLLVLPFVVSPMFPPSEKATFETFHYCNLLRFHDAFPTILAPITSASPA